VLGILLLFFTKKGKERSCGQKEGLRAEIFLRSAEGGGGMRTLSTRSSREGGGGLQISLLCRSEIIQWCVFDIGRGGGEGGRL